MLVSQGNVGIFWSNPLVATIVTLALLMLFWPILSTLWAKVGRRPAAGVSPGQ
jgi:putative tricarboxylic transport membrane protein